MGLGSSVSPGPLAGGSGVGDRGADRASFVPYTVGEQTLAKDLLTALGSGMMVLADRNFLSHTLTRDVQATGVHVDRHSGGAPTVTIFGSG